MNRKNALVLGATGTLGRVIVSQLVCNDIRVVGVARRRVNPPRIKTREPGAFRFIAGDITKQAFIRGLERKLHERNESPDILIHAVGKYEAVPLSKRALTEILETNLISVENTIRTFAPRMCAERYGRIVIVSSMCAIRGSSSPFYAAAKAGLRGLVLSLVTEYARNGVTINMVLPGPIESPMLNDNCGPRRRRQYLSEIPMARFGKPEEISSVVCFLASPEASYVTGAEIPVSGGLR